MALRQGGREEVDNRVTTLEMVRLPVKARTPPPRGSGPAAANGNAELRVIATPKCVMDHWNDKGEHRDDWSVCRAGSWAALEHLKRKKLVRSISGGGK